MRSFAEKAGIKFAQKYPPVEVFAFDHWLASINMVPIYLLPYIDKQMHCLYMRTYITCIFMVYHSVMIIEVWYKCNLILEN